MPYRTEYGTHYHMVEGCCGATIPCEASGLSPCSICCGRQGGAIGTMDGDGIPSAPGDGSPTGDPSPREGDDATSGSPSISFLGRLRAWAGWRSEPTGPRNLPSPPSRRMADLRERWDEIEQVCDEVMRDIAASRFPQKPEPVEAKVLASCLRHPRTGNAVDIGFARKLSETATVIVRWADNSRPMPHRPMGAQLDLQDISPDGLHPSRSATVTTYSLLEAPPDMGRRGFPGIACKSELSCEKGRIRSLMYEGIDSPIWAYGEARARVSLVPLSEEEWRRANEICDSYESDGGETTRERVGDGVGQMDERGEIIGSKVSGTAGYDEANDLFRQAFGSKEDRVVELDAFEMMSSQWDQACDRMSRRR